MHVMMQYDRQMHHQVETSAGRDRSIIRWRHQQEETDASSGGDISRKRQRHQQKERSAAPPLKAQYASRETVVPG